MSREKFNTVDEYIEFFPPNIQEKLKEMRKFIKNLLPEEAEEVISYGIPTFKLNGKYVIYYAAFKEHMSVYPIPTGNEKFEEEVKKYQTGPGTLRFPYDQPVPFDLVKKAVKYNLEANRKRTGVY
jgi:uncharacterized protein YdhG (YjbR/CyaY superfamily)